jgi:hypothetical protein
MKIVAGADWRDQIPFDLPARVADIAPGEPARCALCGADAAPLPREELWAVKHRHPKNHSGFVRFYCTAHKPAPAPAPAAVPAPTTRTRARVARERTAAPRRAAPDDAPKALCPTCFVEVPASGVCGMCGEKIA